MTQDRNSQLWVLLCFGLSLLAILAHSQQPILDDHKNEPTIFHESPPTINSNINSEIPSSLLKPSPASSSSSPTPFSFLSSSSSSSALSLCPDNWKLATSSHVEYGRDRKTYCVRVYNRKETWSRALKRCRKANGFMLKLDAILNTEDGTLFDTLKKRGINKVWTGIHEDHGSLVWDDLRPMMVRPYYGPSQEFGRRTRGWTFDQDSFSASGPFCGALHFGDDGNSAEDISNQSREYSWAARLSGALSRRIAANKRVERGADPSVATPLLVPIKLDTDDNKTPSVGKRMEQFQHFLSNSGFQLTLPSPTEMLAHSSYLSTSKRRNRRMLTTPKVTTTTDQSNHEDDDYKAPTPSPEPNPAHSPFHIPPNSPTTATPQHPTNIDPSLSQLDQILALLSTGHEETNATSLPTVSPSAATNIDKFLDILLQTALHEHHASLTNNSQQFSEMLLQTTTSTPNPDKKNNISNSNIEPTVPPTNIDANEYLRNLLNQATVTASPNEPIPNNNKNSNNVAKEEKALDILSQLLASAMDYDQHHASLSAKTSTSRPREQKHVNSMVPPSLNPSNFMFDSGTSKDQQYTSDQSISASASTELKNKNAVFDAGLIPSSLSDDLQSSNSISTSAPQAEKRQDRKMAIRQGLSEMIRESTSSFFDNILNNVNLGDLLNGVTQSPQRSSTPTPSPSPISLIMRRLLPNLPNRDAGNDILSKYLRSDSDSSKSDSKSNSQDMSTEPPVTSTAFSSSTSTTEVDQNSSGEEDASGNLVDPWMASTTTTPSTNATSPDAPQTTTTSSDIGGAGGEDSGEDLSNDIFTSTTTFPETTTTTASDRGGDTEIDRQKIDHFAEMIDGRDPQSPSREASTPNYDSMESTMSVYDSRDATTPLYDSREISTPEYDTKEKSTIAYDGRKEITPGYDSQEVTTPLYESVEVTTPLYDERKASTSPYDSSAEIPESPNMAIQDPASTLGAPRNESENKSLFEDIGISGNSVEIDINAGFTKKFKDFNYTSDLLDSNNISNEKGNIDAKDMETLTKETFLVDSLPVDGNSGEMSPDDAFGTSKENNASDLDNGLTGSGKSSGSSTMFPIDLSSRVNLVSEEEDQSGKLVELKSQNGAFDSRSNDGSDGVKIGQSEDLGQGNWQSSAESFSTPEDSFSGGGSSNKFGDISTPQQDVTPADTVTMEDCDEERMKSVCMTEPVEFLNRVGHCDRNWFGHRLLDRCYRPLLAPLTELEARQRCLRFGATLAMADTDFYGNVTALVLAQSLLGLREGSSRAWVDTSLNIGVSLDGQCSIVQGGEIHKADCRERFPLICQKDARFMGDVYRNRQLDKSSKTPIYIHNATSFHPQTLLCPLRMSAFDDVIVWYKDGRPIADEDEDDSRGEKSQYGQERAAVSSHHLQLDLSILLRIGSGVVSIPKPAMLQGTYWCEIWRREPFRREMSSPIQLRFTDVITLHGSIRTAERFSDVTAMLANQMGQLTGRTEVINRHLTLINKNVTHFLRINNPEVRDIFSFVSDVREDRLAFQTYICLVGGDVSMEDRAGVTVEYTSALRRALRVGEEEVRHQWRVEGHLDDVITISLPDMCPETQLVDKKTGLVATFPTTRVNTGSLSMEVCDGVYSGTAWCRGNLQNGAVWDTWHITGTCGAKILHSHKTWVSANSDERNRGGGGDSSGSSNESGSKGGGKGGEGGSDGDDGDSDEEEEFLKVNGGYVLKKKPNSALLELDDVEIEEDNLDEISEKLAEVLDEVDDLTDVDIETVVDVVDKIVAVENPTMEISDTLLETVDKVLDAAPENLKKAEEDTRAPTRLIKDLEEFGTKAIMKTKVKRHRHVTPNVAMELWDLEDHSNVVVGIGVQGAAGWASPFSKSKITTIRDRVWMNEHLTDFDIAIELPESLVKNSVKYSEDALRLSMFVYRKVGLFLSSDPEESSHLQDSVINSGVISATLGGRRVQGLDDQIRLVFKPFQTPKTKESRTRCVFWDTRKIRDQHPTWSEDGCVYNGTKNGLEVCLCDHLTNFAILLDFYGDSRPVPIEHQTSLSILTLIGISLSMFGLLVTIITFLVFKKLRQGRAQQTLFNMAVSLLCFQATFLIGFKQTTIRPVCLAVAVSLHYFILVSFAWMLIEAVLQYLTFVKVLGTYIPRYTLKTALPAWIVPLVPVAAVLITDYNLYLGRNDYCWMDVNAFYYSFAMPVGIIIVFNIIMFFIILASLVTRPQGLRSNQSTNKARETNLKAALTIFILLGLTWVFGYMAVEDARLPFQYTFTVLSSLQGFLIFVLMVLRRKQVRDQWKMLFCRHRGKSKRPKQKKLSPVSSSSMSSSNGSSSNGLPSFFNHTYTTDCSIGSSSSVIIGGTIFDNNNSNNNNNIYHNNLSGGFDHLVVADGPSDCGSTANIYDDPDSTYEFRPTALPPVVADI